MIIPRRASLILGPLPVVAAVAFIYGHTLSYPWQFDDFSNIVENPHIRNLSTAIDATHYEVSLAFPYRP